MYLKVRPITNSRLTKEITRKLIIKEIKMDNVWFIPLQSSVTIHEHALSDLKTNIISGSSNEVSQDPKKNKRRQQYHISAFF